MNENERYTGQVERQEWPDSPEVPAGSEFVDDRGAIKNLLFTPITSVATIESKQGSVRANHVHKTDWHYAYVVRGSVLYFEREPGATDVPEPCEFGPGEMFFTPPCREHAMLFPEDSVIMTFAKNVRTHENHEADLERVSFVTPEVAAKWLRNADTQP